MNSRTLTCRIPAAGQSLDAVQMVDQAWEHEVRQGLQPEPTSR
jgi:hypothetical protein